MSQNLHNTYGSFDGINLGAQSLFSIRFTAGEENVTSETPEERIIAWITMWHEWVYFMQLTSTTFRLLVTQNRVRQQLSFMHTRV